MRRFANRAVDHARLLYAFAISAETPQTYCRALEGSVAGRPSLCEGIDVVGGCAAALLAARANTPAPAAA
jgi:hypothetical protein